jgi:formate/nitrite transporter FocA (FNT family)
LLPYRYVTIGFEHYLSSLFFFQTALLTSGAGAATVVPLKQLAKFTAAATLGNFLGGALLVGCGLSQIPVKSKKAAAGTTAGW